MPDAAALLDPTRRRELFVVDLSAVHSRAEAMEQSGELEITPVYEDVYWLLANDADFSRSLK
jgi:hypothetical protein